MILFTISFLGSNLLLSTTSCCKCLLPLTSQNCTSLSILWILDIYYIAPDSQLIKNIKGSQPLFGQFLSQLSLFNVPNLLDWLSLIAKCMWKTETLYGYIVRSRDLSTYYIDQSSSFLDSPNWKSTLKANLRGIR